jgi:hypothetical protein
MKVATLMCSFECVMRLVSYGAMYSLHATTITLIVL